MKMFFKFRTKEHDRLNDLFRSFKQLIILALVIGTMNASYSQCNNCPPSSTYNSSFFASSNNLTRVEYVAPNSMSERKIFQILKIWKISPLKYFAKKNTNIVGKILM